MTDTSEKIDALIAKEEDTLSFAYAKTHAAYREKPSAQNLKDFEAAKAALEEFRKKKHIEQNPSEARFAAPEALNYLNSEGFKIQNSKLYEDKNIIGYKTENNIITFAKKDLDKYAKKFLTPLSAGDSNMADRKMAAEANIAEQKFKDMEFEAKIKEGQYILRSEVEQMLAARAAFLKDNLGSSFIHSRAAKIAEILKGDPDRIPELIEFYLKQVDEVFDYYSKPLKFEVPAVLLQEQEGD